MKNCYWCEGRGTANSQFYTIDEYEIYGNMTEGNIYNLYFTFILFSKV